MEIPGCGISDTVQCTYNSNRFYCMRKAAQHTLTLVTAAV